MILRYTECIVAKNEYTEWWVHCTQCLTDYT